MYFSKRTKLYFGQDKIFDTSLLFFAKVLLATLKKPFRKPFFNFLKGVKKNYFDEEFTNVPSVDVVLPVDYLIPFDKTGETTYLSFVTFSLAMIDFAHREFHGLADAEMVLVLHESNTMYDITGAIYDQLQSTFSLRDQYSQSLHLLHFIDKNRNCFPSMHAQVIGKIYALVADVCDRYGSDPNQYQPLKQALLDYAIKIMSSCLATKQHSVQDLAAGFAILSCEDSRFTPALAGEFIEGILANHPLIPKETIHEIHKAMHATYRTFIIKANESPHPDYVLICKELIQAPKV